MVLSLLLSCHHFYIIVQGYHTPVLSYIQYYYYYYYDYYDYYYYYYYY